MIDSRFELRFGITKQASVVGKKLFGSQVLIKIGAFGKIADVTTRLEIEHRFTENLCSSCRWVDQRHQKLEGGRFSGAVRTEAAEDLILENLKVEIVESEDRSYFPESGSVGFAETLSE